MKTTFAALAIALFATGSVFAGKPSQNNNNHVNVKVIVVNHHNDYHKIHGTSFSGGIFYSGHHHNHWGYQCYWPAYRTTCYWDPYVSCYYYWCESAGCYYPITYITKAAPVIVAAPSYSAPRPAGVPILP
jgi:hypothetical protein